MPITDSLKFYADGSESSGNLVDQHGAKNFTAVNAPLASGGYRQLLRASAQKWTRATGDFEFGPDTPFTVTADVQVADKADYGMAMYQALADPPGSNNDLTLRLMYDQGNDRYNLLVGDGGANANVTASTFGSPAINTPHFLCGIHDPVANELRISVNGGAFDVASWSSGTGVGLHPFQIGSQPPSFYWNGLVRRLALWHRVLDPSEVTTIYNGGSVLTYAAMTGAAAVTKFPRKFPRRVNMFPRRVQVS